MLGEMGERGEGEVERGRGEREDECFRFDPGTSFAAAEDRSCNTHTITTREDMDSQGCLLTSEKYLFSCGGELER